MQNTEWGRRMLEMVCEFRTYTVMALDGWIYHSSGYYDMRCNMVTISSELFIDNALAMFCVKEYFAGDFRLIADKLEIITFNKWWDDRILFRCKEELDSTVALLEMGGFTDPGLEATNG